MQLKPAINAVGAWWQRESYVRTELEILSVNGHPLKKHDAYGRVAMSGEKLWVSSRDFTETVAGLDEGVLRSKTKEELQGLRVAVWYHPGPRAIRHLRVLPAYGNRPLPDAKARRRHKKRQRQ